jgi:GMP synthase-like glutamine amidotransferase
MRVLSVVHQPDAGSGVFGMVAEQRGHELVEWMPAQGPAPEGHFDAVMVFGGGMHPDQEDKYPWLAGEKRMLAGLTERRVPMLCTCLGSELLAGAAGVAPRRLAEPEIGWVELGLEDGAATDPVLGGLPQDLAGFQWHSYGTPLPDGAIPLARAAEDGLVNAFRIGEAWGLQFHAEVTRDIAAGWIERYHEDPDAVRIGLDPEPLLHETDERIAEWNAVGERIASAFLDYAATRPGPG